MIKWRTEIDPDDGLREYRAGIGDISLHIVHAIGRRPFGLAAYRRQADGRNESLTRHGIAWCGTLRACKEYAEKLLSEQARPKWWQRQEIAVTGSALCFIIATLLVCTQAASFSERFGVWTIPPPCWAFHAQANDCQDRI